MSNEIEKALAQMLASMEYTVAEQSLEVSIEDSKFIAEEVDKIYNNFFAELLRTLRSISYDADENFTPSGTLAGTTWEPLSPDWMETKARYNNKRALPFYHGISKFQRKSRQPFVSYIQGLATNPRSSERFFGPTTVSYTVSKAGRSTNINITKGKVKLNRVGPTQAERPFSKAESKKEYLVTTTILSFPKLINKVFREFDIVDSMIKNSGAGASPYKQLVKINGTSYRSGKVKKKGRPIRPIITPMILWQLQKIRKIIGA